jgi:hypothetical protein
MKLNLTRPITEAGKEREYTFDVYWKIDGRKAHKAKTIKTMAISPEKALMNAKIRFGRTRWGGRPEDIIPLVDANYIVEQPIPPLFQQSQYQVDQELRAKVLAPFKR